MTASQIVVYLRYLLDQCRLHNEEKNHVTPQHTLEAIKLYADWLEHEMNQIKKLLDKGSFSP